MSESNNEKSSGEVSRYLAFSLDKEDFAVPLLDVKEVIALPEFTSVPYSPPHFLGIMNLRGQVISVIDLRLKFNMKPQNTSETTVIICDLNPLCIGVAVDSVNQVLSLSADQIAPKPEVETNKKTDFISGVTRVDKKLILLLDIAKTLNVEDHLAMKAASAAKA